MKIRKATTKDLDLVTHIESTCFPPAEVLLAKRLKNALLIMRIISLLFLMAIHQSVLSMDL